MHVNRQDVRALLWFLMCHGKHAQLRVDASVAHTTADFVEFILRPALLHKKWTINLYSHTAAEGNHEGGSGLTKSAYQKVMRVMR